MKILGLTFGEDTELEAVNVVLTMREAALLYRLAGHTKPSAVTEVFGAPWGDALSGLSDIAQVFTMTYDEGVDAVIARHGIAEIVATS